MNKQTVMIMAVLVIGATGFVGFKFAEPKNTSFDVEYKVDCQSCEVYYRNADEQSEEAADVNSTWSYKFTGKAGQFVYLSAINDAGDPVKVTILKNGQPVETGESNELSIAARAGVILN